MKFCCAANGAIKNFKIARNGMTNGMAFIFNEIVIFPKITDFLKT